MSFFYSNYYNRDNNFLLVRFLVRRAILRIKFTIQGTPERKRYSSHVGRVPPSGAVQLRFSLQVLQACKTAVLNIMSLYCVNEYRGI
jgi:hypothetical protein